MARCSSCSAPLPKSGIICAYCGTRNDIDLAAGYTFINVRPNQVRNCPFCHERMQTIDVGRKIPFMVERCPVCYGIFFDNGELEEMVEHHVKGITNVDFVKLQQITENPRHIDIITYRKCPVCTSVMNRKNYAGHSGVIMDVCEEHGVWLDSGELRQILEWVKTGGHQKQQERKVKKRTHKEPPILLGKEEDKRVMDFMEMLGELFYFK